MSWNVDGCVYMCEDEVIFQDVIQGSGVCVGVGARGRG